MVFNFQGELSVCIWGVRVMVFNFQGVLSVCIWGVRVRVFNFQGELSVCIWGVRVRVFNSTVKNISVISWRSVLLLEATRGPVENHRPVTSHWQTLSHNIVHLALIERFEVTTSVVIGTDCILGSCNHNWDQINLYNLKKYLCSFL